MTFQIPPCRPINLVPEMFAEQRQRLVTAMGAPKNTFGLYKGGSEVPRHSSDTAYSYRQCAYFFHVLGVELADCIGAVNLETGDGYVFIPRLPSEYAVWMGKLPQPEEIKAEFKLQGVFYTDEIATVLQRLNCTTVHVLSGTNSDSGQQVACATFDGIDQFTLEKGRLFDVHTRLRVNKTSLEADFFAQLNAAASAAHVAVLQVAKPGLYENHLEATFLAHMMMSSQCRTLAYGAISASGSNPAILHYVENNKKLTDGDLVLVDFGGELHCYASDITCSFPVNGKYSPEQRAVYESVLEAHDAVIAALKPGVSWPEMQRLALRIIGRGLRDKLGLLTGTDEEIEQSELMAAFQPHGLGHLIGLEVHDVGGYLPDAPPRGTSPLVSKLRTARVMEEGIFMTVEPGCYFNAVTLEAALKNPAQAKHLNAEKLRQPVFWNFGGVRIESNVAITATGCRNFTNVPRKVEDVEAVMAGAKWPAA